MQPLIEDRAFVPWLVSHPGEGELMRARRMTPAQQAALEDLWRANPTATGVCGEGGGGGG